MSRSLPCQFKMWTTNLSNSNVNLMCKSPNKFTMGYCLSLELMSFNQTKAIISLVMSVVSLFLVSCIHTWPKPIMAMFDLSTEVISCHNQYATWVITTRVWLKYVCNICGNWLKSSVSSTTMGSNNVDEIYMNGVPDGMMWSKTSLCHQDYWSQGRYALKDGVVVVICNNCWWCSNDAYTYSFNCSSSFVSPSPKDWTLKNPVL